MSRPRSHGLFAIMLLATPAMLVARHVVVIAQADPAYVDARQGEGGEPRRETYVFMEGRYFPGTAVDRTLESMRFRELAGQLAPELARRGYLPGDSAATADLLLVVHWGTTRPRTGLREMMAQPTSPVDHNRLRLETMRQFNVPVEVEHNFEGLPDALQPDFGHEQTMAQAFDQVEQLTDQLSGQMRRSDNVTLLGYAEELQRLGRSAWTREQERALLHDVTTERYFIIVRAYELNLRTPGRPVDRPVWTMHVNIRSPGNNFATALGRMGVALSRFAGTDQVGAKTVKVKTTRGSAQVTFGELIILGQAAPE